MIVPLLLLLGITQIRSDFYGRLDSFEDIGFMTPKNSFELGTNIYFKTYFDKSNHTVQKVKITDFLVDLWNGTRILLFTNNQVTTFGKAVYLLMDNRNNLNDISVIVNTSPDVFDVAFGTAKKVNFVMKLEINVKDGQTYYNQISSVIKIDHDGKTESQAIFIMSPMLMILFGIICSIFF